MIQETRLHTAPSLLTFPDLTTRVVSLINDGFSDPHAYPTKGGATQRLSTSGELYDALGPDGFIAVTYHIDFFGREKAVACACTTEWKGDLAGEKEGAEDGGYEIKAVTSLPGYRKMGLVSVCLDVLTAELVRRSEDRVLKLWVHSVEENTGTYWRKRGWQFVREYSMPAGHYISPNSATGFWLAILLKELTV